MSSSTERTPLLNLPENKRSSIVRTVITTSLDIGITGASALAAMGFQKYAKDLISSFLTRFIPSAPPILAYILSYCCAFPIASLSAVSGVRAITQLSEHPEDTLLSTIKQLWERDPNSTKKWFLIQIASGTALSIWLAATPLSVIASDALNFKRSHTWLSAGPNTATSFLMNGFYLDMVLTDLPWTFSAWLTDTGKSRQKWINALDALKRDGNPKDWSQNQNNHLETLKTLAGLIDGMKNTEKDALISDINQKHPWSLLGLFSLLPAIAFTGPLFHAGQTAQTTFEKTPVLQVLTKYIPWEAISASSLLCNLAINGINAYLFGKELAETLKEIYSKGIKAYFTSFYWDDYVRLIGATFFAALSATAQAGAAYENPLLPQPNVKIAETILVSLAAFALYFRASNTVFSGAIHWCKSWWTGTSDCTTSFTQELEDLKKVVRRLPENLLPVPGTFHPQDETPNSATPTSSSSHYSPDTEATAAPTQSWLSWIGSSLWSLPSTIASCCCGNSETPYYRV